MIPPTPLKEVCVILKEVCVILKEVCVILKECKQF